VARPCQIRRCGYRRLSGSSSASWVVAAPGRRSRRVPASRGWDRCGGPARRGGSRGTGVTGHGAGQEDARRPGLAGHGGRRREVCTWLLAVGCLRRPGSGAPARRVRAVERGSGAAPRPSPPGPDPGAARPGDGLGRHGDRSAPCYKAVGHVGPGTVVGERASLEDGQRTAGLRALTEGRIAETPPGTLSTGQLSELGQGHHREAAH
jgi:hypothetical protein